MDALADSLSSVFPFPSPPFPTQTFKVLILGDCNAGKTTFISRFVHRARRQVMRKRRMQMQLGAKNGSMSPMIVVDDVDAEEGVSEASEGSDYAVGNRNRNRGSQGQRQSPPRLAVPVPPRRLKIQPREKSKSRGSPTLAAFRFGSVLGETGQPLSCSTSPAPASSSSDSSVSESTRSFTFGENSSSSDEEDEPEEEDEDEEEGEVDRRPARVRSQGQSQSGSESGKIPPRHNIASMMLRRMTSSSALTQSGGARKARSPLPRTPTFTSPTKFTLMRRRQTHSPAVPGEGGLTTLRFKRHSHAGGGAAAPNTPSSGTKLKRKSKRKRKKASLSDENEGQEESSSSSSEEEEDKEEEEEEEEQLEEVLLKSDSIREILVTPGSPQKERGKSPFELNHHQVRLLKVQGLKLKPAVSALPVAAPPPPPVKNSGSSSPSRRAKSASRSMPTTGSDQDRDHAASLGRLARERRHTSFFGVAGLRQSQPSQVTSPTSAKQKATTPKKRGGRGVRRATSPQMVISATTEEHSPVVDSSLHDEEYWHSLRKDSQAHLKSPSSSLNSETSGSGADGDLDDEDEIEKLEEEMMRVPDTVQIPARFSMAAAYVSILKRPEDLHEFDFGSDFLSHQFASPASASVDGSRTPLVDDDFGIQTRVKDRRRKLDLEQAHLKTFLEDGRRLSSSFSPITKTLALTPDPEILSEKLIHLNIWDISGAEQFRKISRFYLKNAHGAIFLFDLTNELSFFHFDRYLKMIRKYVVPFRGDGHRKSSVPFPIVIVGHQADRDDEKRLDDSEIRVLLVGHLVKWDDYFPTSSVCPKLRRNISHAFHRLIGKMLKLQSPNKTTESSLSSNSSPASPDRRNFPEIDPPEEDPGIVNLESPMPSEVVRLLRNFEEQVGIAEGTGKVGGCRFCQC